MLFGFPYRSGRSSRGIAGLQNKQHRTNKQPVAGSRPSEITLFAEEKIFNGIPLLSASSCRLGIGSPHRKH